MPFDNSPVDPAAGPGGLRGVSFLPEPAEERSVDLAVLRSGEITDLGPVEQALEHYFEGAERADAG